MKSLLCVVSAVVIFCYLEGKYGLIYGESEQSEMAALRILSAEFEVFGLVQGESWNCRRCPQIRNNFVFQYFQVFSSER